MKTVQDYVIREETMLFIPRYNEYGEQSTHVIEQGKEWFVNLSPTKLMNDCLGYYGASLKGASDGAKKVLGNMHMCPILVNGKSGLYWFSTKSQHQQDCVWFALHHVKGYTSVGSKETKVTLSNGVQIIVNVSLYSFKGRVQKAYELKGTLEERFIPQALFNRGMKRLYRIRQKSGIVHYEVKKEDD